MDWLLIFVFCISLCAAKIEISDHNSESKVGDDNERVPFAIDFLGALNHQNHKTHKFNVYDYDEYLILRRANEFQFRLQWHEGCQPEDEISVHFELNSRSKYKEYKFKFVVNTSDEIDNEIEVDETQWRAVYLCANDIGEVNVKIPAEASIGSFTLSIEVKNGDNSQIFVVHRKVMILFNPYSGRDRVYMEKGIEEYIENESGLIWTGSEHKKGVRRWLFGQFRTDVLDATFFALDRCNLTAKNRSSAVDVSRAFSAAVNHWDDRGILVGRWDGNYSSIFGQHATAPSRWLGSPPILKHYFTTRKPVLYGQCYVFSGVMTTMMRAVGIPSRPVTCYSCAHDRDHNLMIDFYFDKNGQWMEKTNDSIWNYHVWTNAWMRRDDLSKMGIFDGWQDVDGTPQEKSGPKFQMGPTPVNGVKMGIVDAKYDIAFVYSEVNADVAFWRGNSIYFIDTKRIGTSMITKAVGRNAAQNITSEYKADEKSKAERLTLKRFADALGIDHPSFNMSIRQRSAAKKHVDIEISCPDSVEIGSDLSLNVTLKKVSLSSRLRQEKRVSYSLAIKSMSYDGHSSKLVKSEHHERNFKNYKNIRIPSVLTAKEYAKSLDSEFFQIIVSTTDKVTGEFAMKTKDVLIVKPELKVIVKTKPIANRSFGAVISFFNSLPTAATNCEIIIEGNHFPRKEIRIENLKPRTKFNKEVKLKANRNNDDIILFSLNCDEIDGSVAELNLNDFKSTAVNQG